MAKSKKATIPLFTVDELQKAKESNNNSYFRLLDMYNIVSYFTTADSLIKLFKQAENVDFLKAVGIDMQHNREISERQENTPINKLTTLINAGREKSANIDIFPRLEASQGEFERLWQSKYNEAQINGFLTEKVFIKSELRSLEKYNKYYQWCPILEQWIDFLNKVVDGKIKKAVTNTVTNGKKNTPLNFGFKGDKADLKNILLALQNKIEIINLDTCSIDGLLNVLISKNIKTLDKRIDISCETAQLAYILKKLSDSFTNSLPQIIDSCDIFYSKRNVKIKANNLYQANIKSPNPKCYEDIDAVFANKIC